MVSKLLKFSVLILLLATLTGCPGEENCDDYGATARVSDLISITPLKSTYNQGDTIYIKSTIPSINIFFGNQIDLFQTTNDYNASIVSSDFLISGNKITFLKGTKGEYPNWFNATYNPDAKTYEVEIELLLNRTGQYSFITAESIYFQGDSECNRYRLDTNIEGMNAEAKIEFTVE